MIGSIAKFNSKSLSLAYNVTTNYFVRDKLQNQILLIIGIESRYGHDHFKVYYDGSIYLVNKEDLCII